MQSELQKYTAIAAKIILNPERFKTFFKLLNSKEGAVQAALTVVAAVDQAKKVPEGMHGQLAVNAYLLMVDVATKATNIKPSNEVLAGVIKEILAASGAQQGNAVERMSPAGGQPPQAAPQPMPPQDNVISRMGGAA